MRKFKILTGLLGTALLVNPLAAHADESLSPRITLEGKYVDGRVYMPIRAAGDGLSATITWNQKTKTASVDKDGKRLEATVGPFVKLINNRVYIQFREFSNTFFEQDQLVWGRDQLQASSDHFIVNVAPLNQEEIYTLVSSAAAKTKEWQKFLQDIKDSGGSIPQGTAFHGTIQWESFYKFKVFYSTEWNVGEVYYTSWVEVRMKKSFDKWVVDSIYQNKGSEELH